jgi:hypothetical protein
MKDHTDNPLFISFKRAALYILDCVCFSSLIFVYIHASPANIELGPVY